MTLLHLTGTGGGLGPTLAIAGVLVVLGCWYAIGLWEVLDHPQGRRQQRTRAPAVIAGVVLLVAVSVPPLGDTLENRLSTHMAQHLVILVVVAPLLAVGSPGQVLLAGLAPGVRRPLVATARRVPGRTLATPLGWLLSVAGLWVWHLPAAYDAAVRSPGVHVLEHATFLLTGWLFWARLVHLVRTPGRGIAAAAYVAAAVPPGAALGAVLTFADHPLYPLQAAHARATGVDPLLDQRIAGIVMWVPLDLVYLAVAIALFARWLSELQGGDGEVDVGSTLPSDARPAHLEVR